MEIYFDAVIGALNLQGSRLHEWRFSSYVLTVAETNTAIRYTAIPPTKQHITYLSRIPYSISLPFTNLMPQDIADYCRSLQHERPFSHIVMDLYNEVILRRATHSAPLLPSSNNRPMRNASK